VFTHIKISGVDGSLELINVSNFDVSELIVIVDFYEDCYEYKIKYIQKI